MTVDGRDVETRMKDSKDNEACKLSVLEELTFAFSCPKRRLPQHQDDISSVH